MRHCSYDGAVAKMTRGFFGRSRTARDPRLPPGQYDAGTDWPVLNAEVTPRLATDTWTFRVEGLVEQPTTWTWDEIRALPGDSYDGPIHCVTTWSKFDLDFDGVSVDTLLAGARPLTSATHVMAFSHTGYTTNLPLADLTGGLAWVVWNVGGQPLPVEHGGPGAPPRPTPLLLEERKVGRRTAAHGSRRTRVLGAQRLPRSR